MRVRMKLIGKEAVSRKLGRLKLQSGTPALVLAGEASALVLENAWKQKVAGYPLVDTGSYLRSIHHEIGAIGDTSAEILVGTDITDPPYPYFQEFGTGAFYEGADDQAVPAKGDAAMTHLRPRPTARPAWDESQDQMRKEFGTAARRLLSKAAAA